MEITEEEINIALDIIKEQASIIFMIDLYQVLHREDKGERFILSEFYLERLGIKADENSFLQRVQVHGYFKKYRLAE